MMKPHLTCREATRLVLAGEDRKLALGERLRLRMHMLICKACPNFQRQVDFMRSAMGQWRRYAEEDDSAVPRA
jgi:Putative zinc-finger